jgi:hypothetical protein
MLVISRPDPMPVEDKTVLPVAVDEAAVLELVPVDDTTELMIFRPVANCLIYRQLR